MNNLVPVFAHIPKCGGCYIVSRIEKICRKNASNQVFFKSIKNDKNQIAYSIILEKTDDAGKFDLKAIAISPAGFKLIKSKFFEKLAEFFDKNLKYFTVIREPLQSEESLFFYLKDSMSRFEVTHGAFRSESFNEYIEKEMTDSWIIRQICNLNNSDTINESHFNDTISILNNFNVCTDLSKIDEIIDKVFLECGYELKDTYINKKINARRQEIKPNITLESLPNSIKNIFLEKKFYDYNIYRHFIF